MLERIRAIVGDAGVRTGDDIEAWSAHGLVPRAVASPATPEEAAALLSLASREGWAVQAAGGGTWLDAGAVPQRIDLVLSTARMVGVAEYEPSDLTAGFAAGTTLDSMRADLGTNNQWLALDPPHLPRATIGAVVALASAGPLRMGYGVPRDHVLGLELVTGDGRVLQLGGRVVKNVAGYDLVKLVVGSRGTLGVITRVHVRLRPRPESDATVALSSATVDALLAVATTMREERIDAVALEILSPPLAAAVLGRNAEWAMLARFHGNAEAVADFRARVSEIRAPVTRAEALAAGDASAVWAEVSQLEAAAYLSARLADRPSELGSTLRLLAVDDRLPIACHAGDGIVRLLVPQELYPITPLDGWLQLLRETRQALTQRGGSVTVVHGPRELLERFPAFGDPGPALRLMRGLKTAFDPAGIMAPGRFVV